MRTLILLTLGILITVQSYAIKKDPSYRDARRNGAMAKMELKIANDDGFPIPYADVDVFMGMNFRPKGYSITGRTDTNGVFILKGKTCGDEIVVNVAKAGFYERIFDNGERREQKHFNPGKYWIVRSRCKVSPDGKLIEANYSVIYDIVFTCKSGGYGGFCITGAFNPTPNDTNLEPK